MRDFWKLLAHGVLYVFALIVAAIGVLREFDLMTILSPGNLLLQVASVVLFTGGMLAWTVALFKACRSMLQYAVAALSALVGLALTVGAAGVDIWLREELVRRPQFGEMAVWLLVGATLYNIVALWVFHIGDPRVVEAITNGVAEAKILDLARRKADELIEQQAEHVAARIAAQRAQRVMNAVEERETPGTHFLPVPAPTAASSNGSGNGNGK